MPLTGRPVSIFFQTQWSYQTLSLAELDVVAVTTLDTTGIRPIEIAAIAVKGEGAFVKHIDLVSHCARSKGYLLVPVVIALEMGLAVLIVIDQNFGLVSYVSLRR